jgi:protection-of-telomeres protein 1
MLFLTLSSLRANPQLLSQVKEQLFKLWGDLEERKSEMLRQQSKKEDIPSSSLESEFSVSARRAGEMPDADSDVEHESSATSKKTSHSSVLPERDQNIPISGIVGAKTENLESKLAAKNKAFTCCIQQYGVKVDEDDSAKANAGNGKRWQRVFGLFGTQIV